MSPSAYNVAATLISLFQGTTPPHLGYDAACSIAYMLTDAVQQRTPLLKFKYFGCTYLFDETDIPVGTERVDFLFFFLFFFFFSVLFQGQSGR